VDGIFMNHKGVWLNVVGGHHVVSMLAMLVTSEQLSEALAEVLFTAGLVKFLVELFVALLLVGHVGLVLGVVVMLPSLVSVMAGVLGFRVLEVALIVKFADKVVAHVRVEILWIMVAFGLIVAGLMSSFPTEDGLEGHAMAGKSVAGSVGLHAQDTCNKSLGCEVHS